MIFNTENLPDGDVRIRVSDRKGREGDALYAIGARFSAKHSTRDEAGFVASAAQWRDLCRLIDAGFRGTPCRRTFWHVEHGEAQFTRAEALALTVPPPERCTRTGELPL